VIASQEDRIGFYKQFLDGFQILFNAIENRVAEEGEGWQVCLTEWPHPLFNRVFIHSARPEVMVEVDAILESRKIPVLINLIGGGLQHVKALQDVGYVLRWAQPFMIWTSDDSQDDFVLRDGLSVKHLDGSSLDVLKTIYKESFILSDDVVNLMGGLLFAHPLAATYGLFEDGEIVSAVMAIEYEGTIGVWNMATPIAHQKNGYGEQLLRHVMKRYKNLGAEKFFLTSSPAGNALYDKCGWQVVDYIPLFTKP
jgi:ribosomal protein S18 acetylase RimI-like enzyme